MKGIYLTEEGKKELEARIAELETCQHTLDDIDNCSDEDCFYIGETSGEISKLKEILASSTILPVEDSWDNAIDTHDVENAFVKHYPNGVIIQPKN